MGDWVSDLLEDLRGIEEKNKIRDPFRTWNALIGRTWPGIYQAEYALRREVPRVRLVRQDEDVAFHLTAQCFRYDTYANQRKCTHVEFVGSGLTFRSALCDLLTRMEESAEAASVWAYYPPDGCREELLTQVLQAHPLVGAHIGECLRLSYKTEWKGIRPTPSYVLQSGLWRDGRFLPDPYLRTVAASTNALTRELLDRFQRAYGGVESLPEQRAIEEAYLHLQNKLDSGWFRFSFTEDGICAEPGNMSAEANNRIAAHYRLKFAQPVVGRTYEEVLLKLDSIVKGEPVDE